MNDIDLSIIVVGMNHKRFLEILFDSLYNVGRPNCSFEVIYVDNCSKDGSVNFVENTYPDITIIKNEIPLGFSKNNNLGVRKSKGKVIAIINPDIILMKGALDSIYQYKLAHPEIGILVPKLLNSDLTIQFSVRRFINLKILLLRILYNGKDDVKNKSINKYLLKDFNVEQIQEVDWALGAVMIIDREWYLQLNGFDEDYFLYLEDEDLCLRSWEKGKSVTYFPRSTMIHDHQRASSKSFFNNKRKLHAQSMLKFFRKHNLFFREISFMQ